MKKPIVLPKKVHSWTILDRKGFKSLAQCDCGNIKWIDTYILKVGKSKRCINCARGNAKISEKYYATRIYRIWQGMRTRCNNPKRKDYKYYGGRGITVCERWKYFVNFLEDMGELPTQLHTIERKNVNGNYEPSNCVWATMEEQQQNKRPAYHPLGQTGERYITTNKGKGYRVIIRDNYKGTGRTMEQAIQIRDKALKEIIT
jgi:hypothetical protein